MRPLVADENARGEEKRRHSRTDSGEARGTSPVLIVEADRGFANNLRELIEASTGSAESAAAVGQARARVERRSFSAVVVGPSAQEHGHALLNQMRQDGVMLPVLILSRFFGKSSVQRLDQAEACTVLDLADGWPKELQAWVTSLRGDPACARP
jgi:DNA-binding NtrC family response regulator